MPTRLAALQSSVRRNPVALPGCGLTSLALTQNQFADAPSASFRRVFAFEHLWQGKPSRCPARQFRSTSPETGETPQTAKGTCYQYVRAATQEPSAHVE